jgi:hypothetical protein
MTTALITLNEIITAGIAITAFALLLYSLAFNLRDRVAMSFSLLMVIILTINAADAIAGNSNNPPVVELLMVLQWAAIIWLPAGMTLFSGALLFTTGKAIRKKLHLIPFLISAFFTVLLVWGRLLGDIIQDASPAPHFTPTVWSALFVGYYSITLLINLNNIYRARLRTRATTTRRRISYLLFSSLALSIGSFPYLLYSSEIANQLPQVFWLVALAFNIFTGIFIVVMAYSVAFFGVTQPDRVVKNRLARWLLQGPVTAVLTLGVVTIVRRLGDRAGNPYSALVPISMVFCVLLFEYLIIIYGKKIEQKLFYGANHKDVRLLETLQERLFTHADIQQLIETTLASIRDLTRSNFAFVANVNDTQLELIAQSGVASDQPRSRFFPEILVLFKQRSESLSHLAYDQYTLLPLHSTASLLTDNDNNVAELIGMLGIEGFEYDSLDEDQAESLSLLQERITMTLEDRRAQERIFLSLQALTPELERLQQLRAITRFNEEESALLETSNTNFGEVAQWVKNALTHFWGGPKLTENPLNELLSLDAISDGDELSSSNQLRNVLREGIQQLRPQGSHQYTNEWLLYNILDMKFMKGMKVREIAAQLSLSEADYYRKQRVAINELTKVIMNMEGKALHGNNGGEK